MKEKLSYKEYIKHEHAIWERFLSGASASELLMSVCTSNWVRNNPDIDKAIPLAAYWMASPRYMKQFKDRADCLEKEPWAIDRVKTAQRFLS